MEILRKNKLSITGSRKKILNLFLQSEGALGYADIEQKTRQQFDRVTVYRTLQAFVEKGIIHQIPTTDNSVLYALCKDNCASGQHDDDHVHFICASCGKTTCMDGVKIPQVRLPRQFKPQCVEMVVKGICGSCSSPKKKS